MTNPSFYKPRKRPHPEGAGAEVDSSVNLLMLGIIALLAMLVTFVGMLGYNAWSSPPAAEDPALQKSPVDISAPVEAPATTE